MTVKYINADKIGASLSILCAFHCAAMPLLFVYFPLMGMGVLLNDQLENIFLAGSVSLAIGTLILGYRKHHQDKRVFLGLALGISLIALSRVHTGALEAVIAVPGALCIAGSHIFNHHLINHANTRCPHDHHRHD